MIPYGRQIIDDSDIEAVVSVLKSDFLTQGPQVPQFEGLISDYCDVPHSIAFNSATSALHGACAALGVGPGDMVWTSPITFVASANCALYCGAGIDFVDIDAKTYNMSADALEEKLSQAEMAGKLPKVVIPVHFSGEPCDMARISALGKRYGFKIIEDASHAIGGRYADAKIGSCQYSDITVFSFHPVKIITTAEGGTAVTKDAGVAERLALFRSHGVTRDQSLMSKPSEGPWYYEQVDLGFNYRMTELQAALGVSQFGRLDEYVARRHQIADIFDDKLKELPLAVPIRDPLNYSGSHLYVIRVDVESIALNRREVFDALRSKGVGVNVHYIPVHLQPYYAAMGFKKGDFPRAETYYEGAISLPLHPSLSDAELSYVISSVTEILSA